VALRNGAGQIRQTVKTVKGNYKFVDPGVGPWYVALGVGRKQAAQPHGYGPIGPNTAANFRLKGVPASFTFVDDPGTFILLTPTSYSGPRPPKQMTGPSAQPMHTGTAGLNGKIEIPVIAGQPYYRTCWKYCPKDQTYYRLPGDDSSISLNGGSGVAAQANILLQYPACGSIDCR